jgi:hypothetical protein
MEINLLTVFILFSEQLFISGRLILVREDSINASIMKNYQLK